MTEAFLGEIAEWAARGSEMLAVAVVGSHARGAARADSDVDLVLLVANPERYFVSADWIKRFGGICSFRDEDWGRLRSGRVYYVSGLEVEFGLSDATWASTDPVDPGTRTVVAGGLLCVYDPQSILRLLAAAMQSQLIDRQLYDPRLTVCRHVAEVPRIARSRDPAFEEIIRKSASVRRCAGQHSAVSLNVQTGDLKRSPVQCLLVHNDRK